MKFHQKSFSTHFWFLRKSRKVDWMLKFLQNDSELLETQKNKLFKILLVWSNYFYWLFEKKRRKNFSTRTSLSGPINSHNDDERAIFYWLQFNFKCAGWKISAVSIAVTNKDVVIISFSSFIIFLLCLFIAILFIIFLFIYIIIIIIIIYCYY